LVHVGVHLPPVLLVPSGSKPVSGVEQTQGWSGAAVFDQRGLLLRCCRFRSAFTVEADRTCPTQHPPATLRCRRQPPSEEDHCQHTYGESLDVESTKRQRRCAFCAAIPQPERRGPFRTRPPTAPVPSPTA
jgi:hypothetical protein